MTIHVLVPSSLVREAPDKRAATQKLGTVARAAAVFRADRLVVFPDREGERDWGGGFVETVLRYAVTPPDLRTEAFGVRDELEYAGVLPPLHVSARTGSESNGSGSLRQGIVTAVESGDPTDAETGSEPARVEVRCGLDGPISLVVPDGMTCEVGQRVTVRVASRRPVRARIVDDPPPLRVASESLDAALGRDDAGVRIATSRHGTPLTVSGLPEVVDAITANGATIAFGAPERGLPAMLGIDPGSLGEATDFDRWIDAIPDQGSDTVRTEEALFAVLAPLTLRR
jgi:predicted SPOUT superfamily RNA methylase MTH1